MDGGKSAATNFTFCQGTAAKVPPAIVSFKIYFLSFFYAFNLRYCFILFVEVSNTNSMAYMH